jgi:hypothetical protein
MIALGSGALTIVDDVVGGEAACQAACCINLFAPG